jgi:hypothetical protein
VRWRLVAWFSAAVLLLVISAAEGATAEFLSPSAGDRLPAGATVSIVWTLNRSSLEGKDEMELVLSLDDGASFPIRVTGRIEVEARSGSWRVPALPTRHARIALRAGDDEERDSESLLLVSDRFSIDDPAPARPEELYAVGEEIRTREALEGAPVRDSGGDIQPSRTEDLCRAGPEAASLEERAPVAAPDPEPQAYRPSQIRPARREPRDPAIFLRAEIPLRL